MKNKASYPKGMSKTDAQGPKMMVVRIKRKDIPLHKKSNKLIYEYSVWDNKVTLLMSEGYNKVLYECKRMPRICPEEEKEFEVELGEDEALLLRTSPREPYCSGLRKNIKKKLYTARETYRLFDPATNLDFSSDECSEAFFEEWERLW
ncbi:hypothetical protein EROM_040470 [Encephalitozoon romaleae SJ-2008]|uniref:Uncharacterized protein n=1 Tax=Encephalitozoon romaleae (strain SJ-2008) TaxID=1178016 RepID=I7ADY6_ENCRO|nr:hypothetical protein EROM_040470 [Encephalitozoon romaleae SJ-2008]AFN82815.1 hypothetical protein EROM_040470 [Encephalitozoon romaleae SJ-2008]